PSRVLKTTRRFSTDSTGEFGIVNPWMLAGRAHRANHRQENSVRTGSKLAPNQEKIRARDILPWFQHRWKLMNPRSLPAVEFPSRENLKRIPAKSRSGSLMLYRRLLAPKRWELNDGK